MFVLSLNMMRNNAESVDAVAWAETAEELEAFMNREAVEPYSEPGPSGFGHGTQQFHKRFRKGGPLEWYNPPDGLWSGIKDVGTLEGRLEGVRSDWELFRLSTPNAASLLEEVAT